MFSLDLTVGCILAAIRILLNDRCPGPLEVAVMSNSARSQIWLLARWGRFNFITVPIDPAATDVQAKCKWVEIREGEPTIYSGKKYEHVVISPKGFDRNVLREAVIVGIDSLNKKLQAAFEAEFEAIAKAESLTAQAV